MRSFLVFILSVIIFPLIAQNPLLDSLYTELSKHTTEDTVRLKIIFNICYREYTSHPERNKKLAEEALRISENLNSIDGKKGVALANRYISLYYWTTGDYAQASKYAYRMLEICESISYPKGLGQAYQLLGLINEEEKDFEKAKDFYNKAVEIYLKSNSMRDVGYGYNSLGSLYMNKSDYKQATEYFMKSLEVRLKINDQDGLSQSYSNLAVVYTNQKEYHRALDNFEKALVVQTKLNNQFRLSVTFANMGKLYTFVDDYSKAEYYLFKSESIAKKLNQKKVLQDVYGKLSELEKKKNRYAEALRYTEQATIYKDSLYTEEKAKQIAEIETRYETEKKDQKIILLERDKKIQLLWRNIAVASLGLLTILSVSFYFLQRYRNSKNREILNLKIDFLTTQHNELSLKYKYAITGGSIETSIESMDERLLKKVIEVVENNIAEPSFSVEKMAYELGMSRTNMHRKIKAITGFPPSELIRSIRLRKAAFLLANKVDSISQISLLVGFEDHSYFSKAFKKQFGVSPSEYAQSKPEEIGDLN